MGWSKVKKVLGWDGIGTKFLMLRTGRGRDEIFVEWDGMRTKILIFFNKKKIFRAFSTVYKDESTLPEFPL